MSKFKANKREAKDLQKVMELEDKIDIIDGKYVARMSDEAFKYQPFYLAVPLSYSDEMTPLELDEIMKIYFLVWEYYRTKDGPREKVVTPAQFEDAQSLMIDKLQYITAESEKNREEFLEYDVSSLKPQALLAVVMGRFENRDALLHMEAKTKVINLTGIQAFIQCFESL